MSSERAGTPTPGHLDREKARDVINRFYAMPSARVLDALEACVVPDPRLARIEDSTADKAGVRAVLDRARAEAGSGGLVSVWGLENEFEDVKLNISYEHMGDWVPIEWMADQDHTPSKWRCRVCGDIRDTDPHA